MPRALAALSARADLTDSLSAGAATSPYSPGESCPRHHEHQNANHACLQ
jgi:hypothetical protein